MHKYTIEGGINFYEELYKLLDIAEELEEDNNLCLITNNQLLDKFVTLDCGHKFNYIPLFLDTKNHKQKFNGMEGNSGRLQTNEIRCPYCRNKHKGLLPYYEEYGLDKIHGVNFIDPQFQSYNNPTNTLNYNPCNFLTNNPDFDPSGNNPCETSSNNSGNCKFIKCLNSGTLINSNYGIVEGENYGDDKYYCWFHKKAVIKKYKQESKENVKDELKKAKLIAKEELKKVKDEEKQKAKEEKQKAKIGKKQKSVTENLVLGPTIITDSSGNEVSLTCIQILKSGQNKGNHCGCKVYYENLCKRHCNIKKLI